MRLTFGIHKEKYAGLPVFVLVTSSKDGIPEVKRHNFTTSDSSVGIPLRWAGHVVRMGRGKVHTGF